MIPSAQARNAAIHRFQEAEIEGLAKADLETAKAASLRPHYTRIGAWLPAGRGGRVLELGCGPGRYVALLASLGYDVVGVDPLPYELWPVIQKHRNVTFLDGVKAEALPFEDASFDHVACLGALLYFDDASLALSEIRRVLKPGGRLFMRTVNSENLVRLAQKRNIDPAAKNHYNERELADFLRGGGFEVSKTFTYGFFPPVMPGIWWYLVNGVIPLGAQEMLSAATPSRYRVNVVAFAERPLEDRSAR